MLVQRYQCLRLRLEECNLVKEQLRQIIVFQDIWIHHTQENDTHRLQEGISQ